MATEMLEINHLESNCKMKKEENLGMRFKEAQHLKIRESRITQPRKLRGSRQGRRKKIRIGWHQRKSASNRKEWSTVLNVAKGLRKL